MNYLTIVFMEKLADRVSCKDLILKRIQKELRDAGEQRLQPLLLESTCYLSTAGKSYRERIDQWFAETARIKQISQAELQYKRLQALESEGEALHRETQQAFASPGSLNADRIHYLFREECDNALLRLTSAVHLEMYRLVVSGGGAAFKAIPLLKYVHSTVEAYYEYYVRYLMPALESLAHRKRFGVWAYQYRDQARLGALIRLPVYLEAEPKSTKKRLIPGEMEQITTSSSVIWQGMGVITNLSPDAMMAAQEKGVQTVIMAQQLMNGHLHESPAQLLERCFHGAWYAIDPADLFAALNVALLSSTLLGRRNMRKCLYCGAEDAGALLCLPCITKLRQKL